MGPFYLPEYVLAWVFAPGVWLAARAQGRNIEWHDAHPMEIDANIRAGQAPFGGR